MEKSTSPKATTSYKKTSFGIIPRSRVVALEQKGIRKILEFIIEESNKKTEITPQFILDIHRIGFGFIFPDWAGKFRTAEVTVGEYEPPHFSRIPELIKNLCDDLAERLKHLPSSRDDEKFLADLISLLAWFQHRFVWIHPFNDYNGRVARLLTNLILLELDFPIMTIRAQTGKDRDRYIEAMKKADHGDFSDFENIIATALKESLEKF